MTNPWNHSISHREGIVRCALLGLLLAALALCSGIARAQSRSAVAGLFEGVQRIELFLARPTPVLNIQGAKVPVKVYRLYAHQQYIEQTLMPRIPKLPPGASSTEIQHNISAYIEANKAQIEAESKDLKAMYLEGKELTFRYKLLDYPAFVINGVAVFDHTNDLHEALRAYQKHYRGR
ncbi:MAG: DUF1525 domain-containing protein [Hydrogenophaga sp.]|nr:DUF1525 domain-containing protein [Hydrogenophaga sp.]